MDVAVESWRVPTPRDWRLFGGALLLLVGAAVVVVIQRGGPVSAPAEARPGTVPGTTLPPGIRGLGGDAPAGRAGASRRPTDSLGGSIPLHGVSVPWRIVYMNGRGHGDIYEMNDDGSGQRAHVTDPGHDCGPAYSPDGRYMMFSSQRSSGFVSSSSAALGGPRLPWYPINFDLYLLEPSSGTLRQITTNPGVDLSPTWSPDGRQIAFSHGRLGELMSIWAMNPDGSGLRRLTHALGSTFHWLPHWSPDGKRIVYMSTDTADLAHPSIRVVEADGSNDRVLIDDAGFPAWSPDGRRIAFASSRDQLPGEYDVYVADADGSNQQRLLHQEGAEFFPHWSPDGRSIVYTQDPDGWIFEVFMLLPDGAHTLDVEVGGPALSSTWRMRADGSDPVQLTEANGDLFPIYAPAPSG